MFDYRVETFLTVCQEMNYTRAAEILNITQPNVSQHIKWLEEMYQQRLFVYEGRKLRLTKAGDILRNAIMSMRHEDELFRQQLSVLNRTKKRLSFGVTKSIYEGSMKRQIIRFLRKNTEEHLKFMVDNTGNLIEELQNGELDFAIVEGNFDKEKFDYFVLREDEFIPVCAPFYSFEQEVCSLRDLFQANLIVREPGSGSREILSHILESRNYNYQNFKSVMEIGEIGAMKELLKEGAGISFLYNTAVEDELSEGELRRIPLGETEIRHAFCMIWLRTERFSHHYQEIAENFCE